MAWQDNLLSNLLVLGILSTLGTIVYLKVKGLTLVDFFREIKEIFSEGTDE